MRIVGENVVRQRPGVLLALVRASVRSFSASLRMNVLRSWGAAMVVFSEAAGVAILLGRFDGIGGWSTAEVLVLVGIADAGLGLGLLIGEGLEPPNFSQLLRDGRFDQILTRPVSPLTWLITTDVQIRNLGRAAGGMIVLAGAGVAAGIDASAVSLALAAVAVVAMTITVVAVLIIGAAITMYTVEGTEVLNAFTYGGAVLAGWPLQIYNSALRATFVWLVPIGLSVYVPTLWLLDRQGPPGAGRWMLGLVPVVVAAFCAVASMAWRVGLRRYSGVGA